MGAPAAQSTGSDGTLPGTFSTPMEESASADTLPQPLKEGGQLIQTIHLIPKFVGSTLKLFNRYAIFSCLKMSLYKLTTH